MSDHELTVMQDFGPYKKGDRITDSDAIDQILGGEMVVHVRRVFPGPVLIESKIDTAVVEDRIEDDHKAEEVVAKEPEEGFDATKSYSAK